MATAGPKWTGRSRCSASSWAVADPRSGVAQPTGDRADRRHPHGSGGDAVRGTAASAGVAARVARRATVVCDAHVIGNAADRIAPRSASRQATVRSATERMGARACATIGTTGALLGAAELQRARDIATTSPQATLLLAIAFLERLLAPLLPGLAFSNFCQAESEGRAASGDDPQH